jgi:hypothetical protein
MIKVVIEIEETHSRPGTDIAYQSHPGDNVTQQEIDSANVVIAFCSLLSNDAFVRIITPMIEAELDAMHVEQDAALQGSSWVM